MITRIIVVMIVLSRTLLFAGEKIVPVVTEFKVDTTIYLILGF